MSDLRSLTSNMTLNFDPGTEKIPTVKSALYYEVKHMNRREWLLMNMNVRADVTLTLRKHAYVTYSKFLTAVKIDNFKMKDGYISLIFAQITEILGTR